MTKELVQLTERDPNCIDPHKPCAKLDAGKVEPELIQRGFARALLAVADVGISKGASRSPWRLEGVGMTRAYALIDWLMPVIVTAVVCTATWGSVFRRADTAYRPTRWKKCWHARRGCMSEWAYGRFGVAAD